MNYSETTHWLFSQLPLYQNVGKSAYKADLSKTLKLAKQLNHPEFKFKSVHVGGTNGKGSTAHMLAFLKLPMDAAQTNDKATPLAPAKMLRKT